MASFIQNPVQRYSEAQMLAFTRPTAPTLYYFYNTDKNGDLYSMDSTGAFSFLAAADDGDCCSCEMTAKWLCALGEAFNNGLMTPSQYQSAISTGIKITSTNTGGGNCSMTVTTAKVPPIHIVVSGATTMSHTASTQLGVSGTPIGADLSVVWVSMNTDRATVDQAGLVTGVTSGSVVIRAYSVYDSTIYGEITITLS